MVASLAACSDAKSAKSRVSPEVIEAYRSCGEAFRRAERLPHTEQLRAITSGCRAACPEGFERYAGGEPDEALGGDSVSPRTLVPCQLFCNDGAKAEFFSSPVSERWQKLARTCGWSYFDLPDDGSWMLSDTWFVLHKTFEWLRRNKRQMRDSEALLAVAEGTEHTHIQLPLPSYAPELYRLPESDAGTYPAAAFYIVVTADSIHTAALPVARLRDVIETRPVPGGRFPGVECAGDALAELFAEHESQLSGLHHNNAAPSSPPLYLADAKLPARRVLEVARALGREEIQLGVAGNGAHAHKVRVRVSGPSPTLSIDAASPPDADALRTEIAHLDDAPTAGIRVAPDTSVAQLVKALDVLAEVRIGSAIIEDSS